MSSEQDSMANKLRLRYDNLTEEERKQVDDRYKQARQESEEWRQIEEQRILDLEQKILEDQRTSEVKPPKF